MNPFIYLVLPFILLKMKIILLLLQFWLIKYRKCDMFIWPTQCKTTKMVTKLESAIEIHQCTRIKQVCLLNVGIRLETWNVTMPCETKRKCQNVFCVCQFWRGVTSCLIPLVVFRLKGKMNNQKQPNNRVHFMDECANYTFLLVLNKHKTQACLLWGTET